MATVKYTVKDNWDSGFIGNMTVEGGTAGVHGWTVEFDAGFAITNIWGADIVSHVGTHYVIRNVSYNADVPSGGDVTFGFQATPGATGGTNAGGVLLNGAGEEPAPVLPTLAVSDTSVVEGNSGTKQMTFTVSLSQAATGPVTVHYATADGTATAGQDYVAKAGTITFAAGETQKTVSVTVNGDKVAELNETLSLNLSAPTGATIADGAAVGTILTDEAIVPTIVIADATVKEGDSGTRDLAFTVTLSQATTNPVTVTYGTADGTAKAGQDYIAQTGTVTFAPGETSKVINVKVTGDTVIEGNETLKINLTATTGGKIVDRAAIGTITNDDARISVADATVTEGNSGTSDLAFTVALSAATSGPVTVAYTTVNGTAKAGQDYVAQTGTLTFAAGETSKVIRVQVTGDTAIEANETLKLTLSSPTGAAIKDGAAVGTIVNDDSTALLSLSINDASSAEGSAAAPGHTTFTVSLSSAATAPVTVHFATANGTALAGSDYVAQSGTLTFAAGETHKTIQIATIGDAAVEANEGFSVVLTSPTGATIADATGIGTIVNDDVATPTQPTLSISDASVIEGNPGGGAAPGWLSTSGNQIVDSAGHSVQIAGVNWFGFENNDLAPHGLWTRSYQSMMDQMVDLGFNTIRLPFSNDTLHSTGTPNINYAANPDLRGLSALQVMDKIAAYAEQIGLKIILDHHRNDSGAGASDNGLWYDSQHSEASWISDWKMLAERYADNPAVIGADLHNEPFNGTWGGGGPNDWAAAAERAGNAIGEVNPNMLIFVEGVANYQGQSYWWGGNLMGVRDRPIDLAIDNKVVYSAHDYPNSVYAQPWFQGANFAENLPAKFDQMWGYIYKENIAP
ncbi:MAG: endoglucanase, partial [Reyranella sp.]|nr:endoglucanase [Reyranella sp.]